jgi:hypothetical protein
MVCLVASKVRSIVRQGDLATTGEFGVLVSESVSGCKQRHHEISPSEEEARALCLVSHLKSLGAAALRAMSLAGMLEQTLSMCLCGTPLLDAIWEEMLDAKSPNLISS